MCNEIFKENLNYSSFLAVLYLKIGIIVGMVCLCITGILVAVCCYKKKQRVVKDAELEYTRLAEWDCLNSPWKYVKNITEWMPFALSGSKNLIRIHVQNINIQKARNAVWFNFQMNYHINFLCYKFNASHLQVLLKTEIWDTRATCYLYIYTYANHKWCCLLVL